ncbi:bifunctional hydroxymethylpyrimidine kinase/phosphomethylpyrimidine kinase [Acidianus sp. HS-5]|uniref:bifunctional hydroxymethylpyrimidine kinase/phosphomethylpyrimidine kinase n=1 Tax=Acidianus sp. HS-5 TaxID=2886040 RepID=UPI001F032A7C|nr:bifunctional hydroxymethylpyrimidine kinase/phosphomethylpyrimidine kinase [Acidianus sp. HS-5]
MTIAGSDSGGGAGLQADLKTFTSLGVFGTVIVTGLTAQNTFEVTKVMEVPPDFIEAQFDAVMKDLNPRYAKTGMLASTKVIDAVRKKVKEYKINLILDPVMVAKSGASLVTEDVVSSIKSLMKESLIITPNKFEAEKLLGKKIENEEDLKKSTKELYEKYSINAVIKGGSQFGLDYAIIDGEEFELRGEKIETNNTHGSGDVFSASITAYLAKGLSLKEAVKKAKEFTTFAIKYSLNLGKGHGPVDPFAYSEDIMEKEIAREELEDLLYFVEKQKGLNDLLAENDKSNVGYLTTYGDFATLAGGIIRYLDWIKIDGPILVNWKENDVYEALKRSEKKVGIMISPSDRILSLAEENKIKLSESGIDSDAVTVNGKIILVADNVEELKRKIEGLLNDLRSRQLQY